MKRTCLFLFLLVVVFGAWAQDATQRIDELMTAFNAQYKFNGSVLVAQKGKVLIEKGYGWKNKKDSIKVDGNSIYQIGSVTKQFTSAIIMKLQEQGKLNVNDKLSKYFPDLRFGDSITIHNLLTHSSGIYNYTNDGKFMNAEALKSQSHEKMISLFKDKKLDFLPGSKYSYSNSGYLLLGYIIEKVSGKSWEKNMYEHILNPLKMSHSGFDFVALNSKDKATGYFFLDAKAAQPASVIDSTASYAAGSLYSSVGDLYKWERAVTSKKILSPASWEKTFTPFKSKYAYGWIVDSIYDRKIIWHNGGIYGFNSHLLRFPNEELVIILLANRPSPELGTIANSIASIVFGLPYEIPHARVEIQLPEATLQQYAGTYQLSPEATVTVLVKEGKLKTQITGQPEFELFAERENFFFLKVVDAQAEFQKDANGKVDKLIIFQNGGRTVCNKIK